MLKKISTPFTGFLQASGLVSYIFLVTIFFNNIDNIFHNSTAENIAPIIMLLLFIISAVISASLVLGRAGVLFWEKKYTQAFTLIGWTVGWGIVYFILFLTIIYLNQ